MSKIPFFGFGSHEQIAAFKEAGHDIVAGAVSAGDHVLAVLKSSPVAQPVIDAIETIKHGKNADGSAMSGFQKAEHVVVNDAMPLVLQFASGGGVTLVNSAKDTAVALVSSLYNDLAAGAVKASGDLTKAAT